MLDTREVIYLNDPTDDIDYVTLHNILYFIYIGCVNLPYALEAVQQDKDKLPEGFPLEADPFSLYRNADKFLLPKLKELCYFHLENNITSGNVAERLFHPECERYPELKQLYFEYLVTDFDEVKETEGWKRVFDLEDEAVPLSTARYRSRLLFEITKQTGRSRK